MDTRNHVYSMYIIGTSPEQEFIIDDLQIKEMNVPETRQLVVKQSDSLYRWNYSTLDFEHKGGFLYPTYMTIDLNRNVWVSHSHNIACKLVDDANIDDIAMTNLYVGETSKSNIPDTYNLNLQFQNHDGLTVNMNNEIYVLDNNFQKVYVIDVKQTRVMASADILDAETHEKYKKLLEANGEDPNNLYYQALGDWNGMRYFHKFENNAVDVKMLSGSSTFDILPATGKNHLCKINEDYDAEHTMKSYAMQENLLI